MRASSLVRPLIALAALAALATATSLASCDGMSVPLSLEQTVDLAVDVGAATGRAAGQTAPADVTYPLALSPVAVNLTTNPTIAANTDRIRSLSLNGVNVTPVATTLTAATPPIELFVGPAGATSPSQGFRIATLPAIPAGSTAVVPANIDAGGQQAAQPYLTSLDFALIPVATLTVHQGEQVPSGAANLHIVMSIEASVNALK